MVYASATLSLAALEYMVNHPDISTVPVDLIAISADIPKVARIETVGLAGLPSGWREYPAPEALAELGTEWARRRRSPALAVPSAVVPQERNYLINPEHPDFRRIRIGKPMRFSLDPRFRKANS
jgi:RES domain-containing protein